MYRFYRSKSKPYLKQKEALEDLEMQFSDHPVAKIAENSKEVEAKVTAMENMVKIYKKLILKAEAELKKELGICICKFAHAKFVQVKFTKAKLGLRSFPTWTVCICRVGKCYNVQFAYVKFAHVKFAHVKFAHAELAHAKFAHIEFAHVQLPEANCFTYCNHAGDQAVALLTLHM